jgi:hypothetical protein
MPPKATAAVVTPTTTDILEKHFVANAKRGIVLSARQLADFARRRGLKVAWAELRKMRHRFKFTALSSRFTRPLRYMSSSVLTYGCVQVCVFVCVARSRIFFLLLSSSTNLLLCQVDAAWMFKERAKVNGGAVGFLLGVEGISGQLAVQPMKDLTTKSWEKALRYMVETSAFSSVRTFMSDRDSAVKSNDESEGLRAKLKRDYGISWYFLRGRHKAARAER